MEITKREKLHEDHEKTRSLCKIIEILRCHEIYEKA